LALAGAVLAAAVSATVTIEAMHIEANDEQSAEHAMEARRQIADLNADVRGAGSGIRAYLLAKVATDLDHYHASVVSVPQRLGALSNLAGDNPVQRHNIERIKPLIAERFERLATSLQGAEQTAAVLEANQQLLDRVQLVVNDLDAEERRLLELRRAEVASAGQVAKTVSTLGLALSLGLVLLGWSLQRLELNQEKQLTEALTISQAQLQRLGAELAASNKDLDAFAGRIAHDLKNTLTPAAAAAGILRKLASMKGEGVGASLSDLGDRLGRVSARADMMIDSLLAFSRMGVPTDLLAETNVARAVREIVDGLAPQISLVGADIQLDLPPNDTGIRFPPGLFNIVALNLISNAIKFLDGMPERCVRVSARHDEHRLTLTVKDSGPGIAADAIGEIFEPFYRAHGTNASGTGIGLATVYRVVSAYGGSVDVRSTFGKGATFEVRVPIPASVAPSRS
jgi:signal transduction histidine kinase